jgi:ribosomal protein L37E
MLIQSTNYLQQDKKTQTKIMPDSIKCPKCKTWNDDKDYCTHCGHLLNFQILRAQEAEQKRQAEANRPKDKWDIFIDKIKNSDRWIDKIIYYVIQSVWFLIIAIATLGLAFVAFGPG